MAKELSREKQAVLIGVRNLMEKSRKLNKAELLKIDYVPSKPCPEWAIDRVCKEKGVKPEQWGDVSDTALTVRDLNYFKKLKNPKNQIIDGIVGNEVLVMWWSPPKNLKSILALDAAAAVSTGKRFLGKKTKKVPVLIVDLENNEQTKKERIVKICKGLGIRKKPKLYYLARGEAVNFFSEDFIERLGLTIKKYNIKLIILDTFRRMSPEMRENVSDDVSKFYRIFIYLRDRYGISCIFLHHSDKKEKTYRGSSDFGGMVDTAFKITKQTEGKSAKFRIQTDIARGGEIENLSGTVSFHEKTITFETREDDVEEISNKKEFKEIMAIILSFMETAGKGVPVKKSSINAHLTMKGLDVEEKRGTTTRVLQHLRYIRKIDMPKNGVYCLL